MSEPTRPEHLRLFVSIEVPDSVKDEIETAQQELRRRLPQTQASWTRREQFHLTLVFLGNVDAQRVPELTQALNSAIQAFPPLQLRAEQLGFFPNARFPRVLWVGVRDTQNQLNALQKAIQSATLPFNAAASGEGAAPTPAPSASPKEQAEKKRPSGGRSESYIGHVTLARIKRLSRPEAAALSKAAAAMARRAFGHWTAETIQLMRSQLSPQHAVHSTLATFPLRLAG
jgi:2'-5' RNA ligase